MSTWFYGCYSIVVSKAMVPYTGHVILDSVQFSGMLTSRESTTKLALCGAAGLARWPTGISAMDDYARTTIEDIIMLIIFFLAFCLALVGCKDQERADRMMNAARESIYVTTRVLRSSFSGAVRRASLAFTALVDQSTPGTSKIRAGVPGTMV